MVRIGWCPSGRLFEATACGTAVLSDSWEGLSDFYKEGSEILVARSADDSVAALQLGDDEIGRIGRAARERTLAEHTSDRRAGELLEALEAARTGPTEKHDEKAA